MQFIYSEKLFGKSKLIDFTYRNVIYTHDG